MLIAQISDTHMLPPDEIAYGLVDTAAALERAVEAINAAKPDLVIHTGDFAHHGAPEAYALAQDILTALEAPLYAIPGNHDDRTNMRAAFRSRDWMPTDGPDDAFIHYAFDAGPVRVIALDTTIPGEVDGELCKDRLAWLAAALDEAGDRPTLIALHHPPFTSGLPGFSGQALGGAEDLAALVRARPNVVRLIGGHIHRNIVGTCGGAPCVVGPSASYPFAFDTAPDAALSVSFEPPGVAMHLQQPDGSMLSHTVPIGDWRAPAAMRRGGKRLLPGSTKRTADG